MGWMTGFEVHRTLRLFKEIKHLPRQITAKSSKKSANPQPAATKILSMKTALRTSRSARHDSRIPASASLQNER